jgi:hypothetical protein
LGCLFNRVRNGERNISLVGGEIMSALRDVVDREIEHLEKYTECDQIVLYVVSLYDGVRICYTRDELSSDFEFTFKRDAVALDNELRLMGHIAADPSVDFDWYECRCIVAVVKAVRECWARTERSKNLANKPAWWKRGASK